MQQMVSITSQGQVTIPRAMLKELKIKGAVKAVVKKTGNKIIVEPKTDFGSLAGSLKGSIELSDAQLRQARQNFAKQWGRHG